MRALQSLRQRSHQRLPKTRAARPSPTTHVLRLLFLLVLILSSSTLSSATPLPSKAPTYKAAIPARDLSGHTAAKSYTSFGTSNNNGNSGSDDGDEATPSSSPPGIQWSHLSPFFLQVICESDGRAIAIGFIIGSVATWIIHILVHRYFLGRGWWVATFWRRDWYTRTRSTRFAGSNSNRRDRNDHRNSGTRGAGQGREAQMRTYV